MSALNDFIVYLDSDAAAVAALGAATDGLEGEAAFNALAAFAKERGFNVSPADAGDFYIGLTLGQDELSDEQLEDVAGGASVRPNLPFGNNPPRAIYGVKGLPDDHILSKFLNWLRPPITM